MKTRPKAMPNATVKPKELDISVVKSDIFQAHNILRRKFESKPLVLDNGLSEFSQQWAEKLAAEEELEHRQGDYRTFNGEITGENIAYQWSSGEIVDYKGGEAVCNWYNEIVDHDFENPTALAGHFTQVVWSSSQRLGIGIGLSKKKTKIYIVCNYIPAGNMAGSFVENVPMPTDGQIRAITVDELGLEEARKKSKKPPNKCCTVL